MPDINELIENLKRDVAAIATTIDKASDVRQLSELCEHLSRLYIKLEAYLEMKEWLDAWMSANEVKDETDD